MADNVVDEDEKGKEGKCLNLDLAVITFISNLFFGQLISTLYNVRRENPRSEADHGTDQLLGHHRHCVLSHPFHIFYLNILYFHIFMLVKLTEVSLCLEELIMVMLTVKMMLVRYIVRWTDHTTTMCASKTAFMRSYLSSKNTKVKHHDPNLKAKPNPDRKNHDRAQSNWAWGFILESSPDWKNNQAYPPLLFISFLPSTNSQFLLELKLQPNLQAEQGLGAMICFIDIYVGYAYK
ncbi:hypothetical protein G4B88_030195 [Cannabis sativa]|uniref:Uncharacterized protein n=1 Tax=Cannabis sativa TaxID=3483 RepID=A0A7J6EZC4_CANSA|nr:hypothetical protein G4B88_030195 [Cannabis sativa]